MIFYYGFLVLYQTVISLQALKQMYMLVLGLDVIGNPVGLLLGIGEGVTDLFYEPFQGAIQGPEEFAEGLALGVKSLFGHAIGKLFYRIPVSCKYKVVLIIFNTSKTMEYFV